ncbi:peptidase M15A [Halieaceae bacterium IMCC14734]|uniref:Peptidase M15A n=1 Tax=Candidatus Litorirhabdus singularis TaxID=2518993 RepID=A0ABT3TCV1_9GAMM|nr:D-Ala-D-Ala carboxypeptidase family metallohydrolase [Candidatus Litorirhabdus singularis]MCX2980103.1 peptidase M15A [Candidatus Litorirhabdus singularis]
MRPLPSRYLVILILLTPASASAIAPIPITARGLEVDLAIFSLFLTPEEEITIAVNTEQSMRVEAPGMSIQQVRQQTGQLLQVRAPAAPGIYPMHLSSESGAAASQINIIVLTPFANLRDGMLNGYRVGEYPQPRQGKATYYAQPTGFIEVTEANMATQLTPHFTLAQFLCKQEAGFPKYLVLRENLLVLLEDVLQHVNSQGFSVATFGFISGYRTPWYNRKIGNVTYSRHIYGDAADIYIDQDLNGRMDDLNLDGAYDGKDMELFFALVEQLRDNSPGSVLPSGIGRYKPNRRHGGFIHVDTRGYPARW